MSIAIKVMLTVALVGIAAVLAWKGGAAIAKIAKEHNKKRR